MSYPQNNVVYPSMLMNSPESFMGHKKAIKLAGRILSIRHYTVRSGSPRTQILIGDSPESYMQLLQFRQESTPLIPSSMIGKHIVFEPVTLSQSNKMFDSSPCPLTAILSDLGYRFTEQHIDPKIAPAGLFSFDKFLPVLTTLDKIRPDTCVNVFGKIETIIDQGTGDDSMKFKVIDGSIGIIASTLVVIPKGGRGGKGSDSFTDVYSIDGHALDRAKEGDYILMLDMMMSGISLEDGQLTQTLRAWGPTRIKIDILNETLKSNLERRFSTNDDKEYCSGAKYAESRLPSCKIFDRTTKKSSQLSSSSTVIVYGVLTSFLSSSLYTRTRRVWTQGTDNTNEGVDWEDDKYGRLQDKVVFDLQALFHECQTVFRYSNKAAARLLNVSSADEFASMEENEKESRLLDVMYRAMVFKAWKTSSGDIMILDVVVFPGVITDVSNINNGERKDGEAVVSDGQVHHPVEKKKCCENEQSSLAMFDI